MPSVNRPPLLVVLAIFHFIVGGIGVACNICGGVGQVASVQALKVPAPAGGNNMARDIEVAIDLKAPGARTVQIGDSLFSFLLYVMLIVAGVGLLLVASWGRTLSIVFAAIVLMEKVFFMGYAILVMFPALDNAAKVMLAQARTPQERTAMEVSFSLASKGAVAVPPCFAVVYAVIVLLLVNTNTVKAAFEAHGAPARSLTEECSDLLRTDQPPPASPPWPGDDPFHKG